MMIYGNAKLIASLPMYPNFSVQKINRLCRNKKLYGFKKNLGPFAPWIIPVDSFALYLLYHPVLAEGFYNLNADNLMGSSEKIQDFYAAVHSSFRNRYKRYEYTVSELSTFFDITVSSTYKRFVQKQWYSVFLTEKVKGNTKVPLERVLKILCTNRDLVNSLEYHHFILVNYDSDHRQEREIEKLLMLYTYYNTYGYLN